MANDNPAIHSSRFLLTVSNHSHHTPHRSIINYRLACEKPIVPTKSSNSRDAGKEGSANSRLSLSSSIGYRKTSARTVSFDKVNTRQYTLASRNHSYLSQTVFTSSYWKFDDLSELDIDEHERNFIAQRRKPKVVMPSYPRKNLPRWHLGRNISLDDGYIGSVIAQDQYNLKKISLPVCNMENSFCNSGTKPSNKINSKKDFIKDFVRKHPSSSATGHNALAIFRRDSQ